MIIARLTDRERYESLHPLLKQLFDYVESHDFSHAPAGRTELQGDDLFVNLDETTMVERAKQRLEVHRRYIDVHIPLTTAEDFGWRHLSTLGDSDEPFDELHDRAFYTAPSDKWFKLRPGEFCIVFPEDAHAPVVGSGTIRKLVGKLKI
jgi:biofilm protein TabA